MIDTLTVDQIQQSMLWTACCLRYFVILRAGEICVPFKYSAVWPLSAPATLKLAGLGEGNLSLPVIATALEVYSKIVTAAIVHLIELTKIEFLPLDWN